MNSLSWGTRPAPRVLMSGGRGPHGWRDLSNPTLVVIGGRVPPRDKRQPLGNAVEALRQDLLITQWRLCEKGSWEPLWGGGVPHRALSPNEKRGAAVAHAYMSVASKTHERAGWERNARIARQEQM